MSSLLSTLSMLPSHLTVEMAIVLCVGMKMMVVIVETSINPLVRTLIGTLAGSLAGEFSFEEIQHSRNERPCYLTCSKVENLRLGWSIIDRKHDDQRSIGSRFSLNLI